MWDGELHCSQISRFAILKSHCDILAAILWVIKSLKNQRGRSAEVLERGAGALLAAPAVPRVHWRAGKALPPSPEPSGSPHLPPWVPAGSPGSRAGALVKTPSVRLG